MRTINQWLDEYGESHQNETNKAIHWICVPTIFFTIIGLLYCIKFPVWLGAVQLNAAMIVVLLVMLYYMKLSKTIWVGMLLFCALCLFLCYAIEYYTSAPLWLVCVILFVAAWVGQFYGHKIEGKKPSFLKDIQFLMIGPMWLMSAVYKKAGIPF